MKMKEGEWMFGVRVLKVSRAGDTSVVLKSRQADLLFRRVNINLMLGHSVTAVQHRYLYLCTVPWQFCTA